MPTTPAESRARTLTGIADREPVDGGEDIVQLLRQALAPAFVLVRKLGAGGMGIVYLARDPALKRLVAVKVMSPDRALDADARARFQREAEAVAKIAHPNVVAVYSVGELANGVPYLVMQYVEGRSMAARLAEEGPLDVPEAQAVLGQVAAALAAAHAKGVVHRDIKAENILWDDASGRALVSDFGIAALLQQDEDDADTMALTKTGMVVGTPRYMSPEQLLAERVNEKTDIYSLGLLGYDLLAREGPFPGITSPQQLIVAHLRDAPRPITTLRADVDPTFEALLGACLAKDPHARPVADDIARRLRHSTSAVLEWPPPGLEDLQGAAVDPARTIFYGSLGIAAPLAIMLHVTPASPFYLGWPASLVFPLAIVGGGLACASGVVSIARQVPLIARAAKAGYGWDVLAAVLVDAGKDMGSLLAGEREYSMLTPERRATIRRWRMARVGLDLAGAAWAVGGVLLALPFGARVAGSPVGFAFALLGVPVAAQLFSLYLRLAEHQIVGPGRERIRRHSSTIDRLTSLAGAWKESFDRVVGARFAAARRTTVRRLAAIAAGASFVVAGLGTITGLAVVGSTGQMIRATGVPVYSTIEGKVNQVRRLRFLATPVDARITPLQAGQALLAFQRPSDAGPFMRPAPDPVVLEREPRYLRVIFNASDWRSGVAMQAAARGLTTEQRQFLAQIAAGGGQRQLEIIARAPAVDWFSAAVPDDALPRMAIFDVPEPATFRIEAAVRAHTARAVLARADGRIVDAERMIREVIGVGFKLMDGHSLMQALIGTKIVNHGRDDLIAIYESSGRAAAARPLVRSLDPPIPDLPNERWVTGARLEDYITRLLSDSTALRAVRWEVGAQHAAFEPCTELREIIFGADASHAERLAAARQQLVRTPGDAMILRVAENTLDVPLPAERGRSGFWPSTWRVFARGVDGLTGSRRMSSCLAHIDVATNR